jgi:hypothetical protein
VCSSDLQPGKPDPVVVESSAPVVESIGD